MAPDKKLTVWIAYTPDMQEVAHEVERAMQERDHDVITVVEFLRDSKNIRIYTDAQVMRADVVLAIVGADVMRMLEKGPEAEVAPRTQRAIEIAARLQKRVVVLLHASVDLPVERIYPTLRSRDRGSRAYWNELAIFERPEEAVRIALEATSSHKPPPPRTPLPSRELLILAWRLAADLQVEPQVLLHLDPAHLQKTVDEFAAKNGLGDTAPAERAERVLRMLEERQSGKAPSALWMAWMQTAREQTIAAASAALVADREPPFASQLPSA